MIAARRAGSSATSFARPVIGQASGGCAPAVLWDGPGMKTFCRLFPGWWLLLAGAALAPAQSAPPPPSSLWDVYTQHLKGAKYVDLTHTITPSIPVWAGFASPKFARTVNPKTGKPYEYKTDNFEASAYDPAHRPARHATRPARALEPRIIPPSTSCRPRSPCARWWSFPSWIRWPDGPRLPDAGRPTSQAWEKEHGPIPEGSVVFIPLGLVQALARPEAGHGGESFRA